MSPEQVLGSKQLDHRTDLWSLGVMAFEALTGRHAFDAETIGGLSIAICNGPMPVPSAIAPELPPAFDAWFARACARDLNLRFRSAKELGDALAAALGDNQARVSVSVPGHPAPSATLAMRTTAGFGVESSQPRRASGVRAALIVAGIAALGGVAGVGMWMLTRTPPATTATTPETSSDPSKTKKNSTAAAPSPPIEDLAPVVSSASTSAPTIATASKAPKLTTKPLASASTAASASTSVAKPPPPPPKVEHDPNIY